MRPRHLHPHGRRKKSRRNLRAKFVSRSPSTSPERAKVNILGLFLLGGGYLRVYLVRLDYLLRAATNEKGRQLFLKKKVHPDKILATSMTTAMSWWFFCDTCTLGMC